MRRAAKLGVKWEGAGRARAQGIWKAPQAPVSPGPVESPGTPPLAFRDDEEEEDT